MKDLKKKFGKRLREIRKSKRLTQEELAEALDIALPNISYIENGRTFPSVETQEKLCNVLNVKIYELYVFDDEVSETDMKNEIIESLNDPAITLRLYKYLKTFK